MKTFSTFEVEKLLQVKRTALQEWLNEKFIKPIRLADGKGTKTEFSVHDLYRITLFMNLRRLGASRIEASDYSGNVPWNKVGTGESQIKYAYKESKRTSPPLKTVGVWKSVPKHPRIENDDQVSLLIVNLTAIKKQVDTLLGG